MKPTLFPQADELQLTTEVYTQRNGASAAEANFRFTLHQVYLFLQQSLGFSSTIKHVQTQASATWTIAYSLPSEPQVQVFVPVLSQQGAPSYIKVMAQVVVGNGQVVISFNEPLEGYALLTP